MGQAMISACRKYNENAKWPERDNYKDCKQWIKIVRIDFKWPKRMQMPTNGCKMIKDLKWPEWHTEIRHILPKQDNALPDPKWPNWDLKKKRAKWPWNNHTDKQKNQH